MVIELDFASDTPIYVQLRNQIVKGIGKGELKAGEKPTEGLVHLSPRILIWILNSGKSLNQNLSCCQQKQALLEWIKKNS